jgi:exopolysaccharide biosynthesis polyprenyl glycosylphosphotransferase
MTQTTHTHSLTGPLPVAINARWAERILLSATLILMDLIMVTIGFGLAYILRFETGIAWAYQYDEAPLQFYQGIIFLLVPIWLLVFKLFGLYDFKHLFGGIEEYARVFNACTLGMMLVIVFTFLDVSVILARAWVILAWVLVTFSVASGRFILRRVVRRMRANGRFLTTVLIVGANEEARAVAEQLQANQRAGILITGFAADEPGQGGELLPGIPVLGPIDAVETLVRQHGIQELIVASSALQRAKLIDLLQAFDDDDLTIRLSSGLYEILTTGVEVQEVGNVPLLSINKVRLTGVEMFMKWVLDQAVSIAVLLITWPFMLAIAIAVKRDSPGPIFYHRQVIGVGGKPFGALKFRTMYIDADERLARDPALRRQFEENFKLKDDPRVTRVGRFLRRTSLDELPQVFNVLRGQMSWVGPRMITAEEQVRYGKWRMNLCTVKPGITGLWQISGRSDVGYKERVMLDMHYIRNYSIWLDLYVLWRTVPVVLKGHGAY